MSRDIQSEIKSTVESNAVCLYMKGTPDAPQCGFSAQVIHILNQYEIPYHTVNVLDDYDVREGIKEYTSWPTIPQLYAAGKFVGGCDVAMELHRKGELQNILKGS